jgi:hypothetical protein
MLLSCADGLDRGGRLVVMIVTDMNPKGGDQETLKLSSGHISQIMSFASCPLKQSTAVILAANAIDQEPPSPSPVHREHHHTIAPHPSNPTQDSRHGFPKQTGRKPTFPAKPRRCRTSDSLPAGFESLEIAAPYHHLHLHISARDRGSSQPYSARLALGRSWSAVADEDMTRQLRTVEQVSETDIHHTSVRDHVNHWATLGTTLFAVLVAARKAVDGAVARWGHPEHCAPTSRQERE